jgi:hypothetical protein
LPRQRQHLLRSNKIVYALSDTAGLLESRGKNAKEMRVATKSLFLLLILPTLAIAAKWEFISASSDQAYFLDFDSIQTGGDSVTFWVRTNYRQRDRDGALSDKVQQSINCARREFVIRYAVFYEDVHNGGKVISQERDNTGQWSPIPPDSVIDSFRKKVCP